MKRLIFLAAIALAALTMRAQNPKGYNPSPVPVDSVSVMLRHLANTNAEVQHINDNLRLHSQIAVGSFAMMGVSAFCFYRSTVAEAPGPTIYHTGPDGSWVEKPTDWRKAWKTMGIVTGAVGCVGFVCSFIPIWNKKVRLDNRGLVISLNK